MFVIVEFMYKNSPAINDGACGLLKFYVNLTITVIIINTKVEVGRLFVTTAL